MGTVASFNESYREGLIICCINAEKEYHVLTGKAEAFDSFQSEYAALLNESYSIKQLDWLLRRQIKRNCIVRRKAH